MNSHWIKKQAGNEAPAMGCFVLRALFAVAVLCSLCCCATRAQEDVNSEVGQKSYGSYITSDMDSVSLTNGNLMLHIPVASYPQRGGKLDLSFFLRYNNKGYRIWQYTETVGTLANGTPITQTLSRWQWNGGGLQVARDQVWEPQTTVNKYLVYTSEPGPTPGTYQVDKIFVTLNKVLTPDGGSHITSARWGRYGMAPGVLDGSGLGHRGILDFSGINVASYPYPSSSSCPNPNSIPSWSPLVSEDSNGNMIQSTPNGWLDTMGRLIPGEPLCAGYGGAGYTGAGAIPGGFSGNNLGNADIRMEPGVGTTDFTGCPSNTAYARIWNLPSVGGTIAPIKFCYADVYLTTNFGVPHVDELYGNVRLLQNVILPNGTMWSFSYNSYGDLTSVTYPTGGAINYSWATFQFATGMSRAVTSRTLYDNTGPHTWNYSWTPGTWTNLSGPMPNISVVVTDPQQNDSLHVSSPMGNGSYFETHAAYYQGSSANSANFLKSVDTSYLSFPNPFDYYLGTASGSAFPKTITTTWASGKVTQIQRDYDPLQPFTFYNLICFDCVNTPYVTTQYRINGQVTQERVYDYGQGAPGPLLRSTSTSYYTLDDPASVVVADGNGNKCSETDYTYDDPSKLILSNVTMQHGAPYTGAVRANLSTETRQLSATPCSAGASWAPITSSYTHFDTGEKESASDPLGHTTHFVYADAFYGTYLTQITFPATSSPALAKHVISRDYDFNTGLLTTSTDENGNSSNYAYNDPLHRMTSASFPDGGRTDYDYPGPTTIEQRRKINATLTDDAFQYFDGIGRPVQTQHMTPDGNVVVDTAYDALGQPVTVNNPHLTASDPTYGVTQTQYDALGRPVKIVMQDGGFSTADYTEGNCTTTADEAGLKRRTCTDGLERLVEVDEPNPSVLATSATASVNITGAEQSKTTPVTTAIAVGNSGFESPTLAAGSFQYGPTGGTWTFSGGTGLSASGSGFTAGNPPAPDGGQVAFVQGGSTSVLSQTLSGFQSGVNYAVTFYAAQRGNYNPNGQTFNVYLDSTLLGTFTPGSSNYTALSTASFTTTAGSHTLSFVGGDTTANGNTAFLDAVRVTGTSTATTGDTGTVSLAFNGGTPTCSYNYGATDTTASIAQGLANAINAGCTTLATAAATSNPDGVVPDSGFESPSLGSGTGAYQYHPMGSTWTFSSNSGFDASGNIVGGAGLTGNNSAFTSANPPAPEGAQVAFVQGGSQNYFSQSLSVSQGGAYKVTFKAAQRVYNGQTNAENFDVLFDGVALIGTFQPASGAYTTFSTSSFNIAAGAHTLTFQGRGSAGADQTAFIDDVRFVAAAGNTVNLTSKSAGSAGNSSTLAVSITDTAGLSPSFSVSVTPSFTGGQDAGALNNHPLVTQYQYDALDDLLCVLQKGTDTTPFTNCAAAPAAWRPRSYTYSSLGQLLAANNPESGLVTYAYDNDGNMIRKTAPAQNQTGSATVVTTHTYDALHRLTSKSYSDGTTPSVSNQYDETAPWGVAVSNPVGRLTSQSVSSDTNMVAGSIFSYDPVGRVKINNQCTPYNCSSVGFPVSYNYDFAGNVTSYTTGVGAAFTQTFDAAGRLMQLTSNIVDAQHPGTLATVDSAAGYYPSGAIRKITLGDGLTETAALNTRLQPCRMNVNSSGSSLSQCTDPTPSGNVQDFTYGFNLSAADNGNLAFMKGTGAQQFGRVYTYDSLNRLATMTDSDSSQPCNGLSWTYDPWGNRTDQTVTTGTCNTSHVSVNAKNQLSGPYQYDAAGNLINDGSHTYTYDAENRIVQVDGGNTATYLYDASGRRVQKTVPGRTNNYVYDLNGNVVTEVCLVPGYTGWCTSFIYFGGGLAAEYKDATTYFVHKDHLGSTRLVTGLPAGNSPAPIVDSLDYLPYGEQISGDTRTTHKFTGKERDAESGLDDSKARYYGSLFGLFLSPDPDQLAGIMHMDDPQSWNGYAYARGNPLKYVDPDGHKHTDYILCDEHGKNCSRQTEEQFKKNRKADTAQGEVYVDTKQYDNGVSGKIYIDGQLRGTYTYDPGIAGDDEANQEAADFIAKQTYGVIKEFGKNAAYTAAGGLLGRGVLSVAGVTLRRGLTTIPLQNLPKLQVVRVLTQKLVARGITSAPKIVQEMLANGASFDEVSARLVQILEDARPLSNPEARAAQEAIRQEMKARGIPF